MAKVDKYAVINVTILDMVSKSLEEELGVSIPEDVYQRVVEREGVIKKMYVTLGLKGREIDRTWDNLLGRAKTNIVRGDSTRKVANDILSSSHRRTVYMGR